MADPSLSHEDIERAGYLAAQLIQAWDNLDERAAWFRDCVQPDHPSRMPPTRLDDLMKEVTVTKRGEGGPHNQPLSEEEQHLAHAALALDRAWEIFHQCLVVVRDSTIIDQFRLATPSPAVLDDAVSLSYFEAVFARADKRLDSFEGIIPPDRYTKVFMPSTIQEDLFDEGFRSRLSDALLRHVCVFELSRQGVAERSELSRYQIVKETQRAIGRIPRWHYDYFMDYEELNKFRRRAPLRIQIERKGDRYELTVNAKVFEADYEVGEAFRLVYEAKGRPVGLSSKIGPQPQRVINKLPPVLRQHIVSSKKGYSWDEYPEDRPPVQP